jgi:D-glycero-alpha-D-manno-heptose 1-phosphate guanylyltransferase
MKREAIILSGGLGTRLRSVIPDLPKTMALIENLPFLSYLLEQLFRSEFERVVLATGYRSDAIESFFGSYYKEINLVYSIEEEPLGTGGAILKAADSVDSENFFILNGDTFFDVDFGGMEKKFKTDHSGLMIALKPMKNFERYGVVLVDGEKIVSFKEKKFCETGLINGGTYLGSKKWLKEQATGMIFSLEKEILEKKVKTEKIGYFISEGYFIDIGVPEDYFKAIKELPVRFKNLSFLL